MDCYLEEEIGPKKYICFFHVFFFLNFGTMPVCLNIIDDAERRSRSLDHRLSTYDKKIGGNIDMDKLKAIVVVLQGNRLSEREFSADRG